MTYYTDEMNTSAEETSLPPFNREEWIQQKKAEREKAFELIEQAAEMMPMEATRASTSTRDRNRFMSHSSFNILPSHDGG